jgi:hypothetical protein
VANDMPEVKGFSERNLKYMIRFGREYGERPIVQQPAAQLPYPTKGPTLLAQLVPSEIGPQAAALLPGKITKTPSEQLAATDALSKMQQLVAQIPWATT